MVHNPGDGLQILLQTSVICAANINLIIVTYMHWESGMLHISTDRQGTHTDITQAINALISGCNMQKMNIIDCQIKHDNEELPQML